MNLIMKRLDNEFKKYIDINDKNLYKTLDSVSLETDVFIYISKRDIITTKKIELQDKSLRLLNYLIMIFSTKKIPMYLLKIIKR